MEKIINKEQWDLGKNALMQKDPVMNSIIKKHQGMMQYNASDAFETLCRSIIGQQISTKAASSIWHKLRLQIGEFRLDTILHCSEIDLKNAGLSRQKAAYIKNIAQFFASKQYTEDDWQNKSYDQLSQELTSIKGVGTWTFEMFAMFHLRFADIFPIKDIGIIRSMEKNYNNTDALDKEVLLEISHNWTPWKSIACWYLWEDIDAKPNKNIEALWS